MVTFRKVVKEATDAAAKSPGDAAAAAKAKFLTSKLEKVEEKWAASGRASPQAVAQSAPPPAAPRAPAASIAPPTRSQMAMKASELRLANKPDESSALYLKAAEKPSFSDRNFSSAFEESVKGSGETARQMAREAHAGGPSRLNEFVNSLESEIPKSMTETQRTNLLGAVQELRKVPPRDLHLYDAQALKRVERRLMTEAENPAAQVSKSVISGKRDNVLQIYQSRLSNGWSRESVRSELSQELLNAQMMSNSIKRSPRGGDASHWDKRIQVYQGLLKDLDLKP